MEKNLKFTFIPYTKSDGVPTYRDSDIYEIYNRCVESGLAKYLFNDGSLDTPKKFFDHVTHENVLFYGAYWGNQLVGFFFLNHIFNTRAFAHFAVFPQYWGEDFTVPLGKAAMKHVLYLETPVSFGREYLFDIILGLIPENNIFALKYVYKLGFKHVGNIPNMIWDNNNFESIYGNLYYLTRKEIN